MKSTNKIKNEIKLLRKRKDENDHAIDGIIAEIDECTHPNVGLALDAQIKVLEQINERLEWEMRSLLDQLSNIENVSPKNNSFVKSIKDKESTIMILP